MRRKVCDRHGQDYPCTCAMGNVYRFVEPVVLLLLREKGRAHGYELSRALQDHALTDAEVERAALYRTLRQLEANGNVVSEWQTDQAGPARRVYSLTPEGAHHLDEWATVLAHLSASMAGFVTAVRNPRPGVRPRRSRPGTAPPVSTATGRRSGARATARSRSGT